MARDWKRLAILLLAYAGAVCAALSGWFGGQAANVVLRDDGLALWGILPQHRLANMYFVLAVALGIVFAVAVWRLVPAGPPAERK